jgi:hypothetical protein
MKKMLDQTIFKVGKECRVVQHTCEWCGHESTILLGSGYEDGKTYLVSRTGYQCDCDHYWVRYICPKCRKKLIAQTNRRRVPGDDSGNSTWKWRKIWKEDLERYLQDFGHEVEITEEESRWLDEVCFQPNGKSNLERT